MADARKATARYEAQAALLDALVESVAQATVEYAVEGYGGYGLSQAFARAFAYRRKIARDVLRQTVGCAREDPDSEYAKVLEAMGVER